MGYEWGMNIHYHRLSSQRFFGVITHKFPMAFDPDEPLVHPWVRVDRSVAALVATLGATRHMSNGGFKTTRIN